MENPAPTSAPERLTRKERKRLTRQRIIDAAIDIVRTEGIEGLTTVRLAQAAQITQPGFYVHFKNVEDCLLATAEYVVERSRRAQTEARRRAFAEVRQVQDIGSPTLVARVYDETLRTMLSEPRFAELFLRYRRDPSPLGRKMAQVMEQTRHEIAEDMRAVNRRLGVTERQGAELDLLAELILFLYLGAAEALLDGRATDISEVVETLTRVTRAALLAELSHFAGING